LGFFAFPEENDMPQDKETNAVSLEIARAVHFNEPDKERAARAALARLKAERHMAEARKLLATADELS
jgi:hypothetical protein